MSWSRLAPHEIMRIDKKLWPDFQQFLVLERGYGTKNVDVWRRLFCRLADGLPHGEFTRKNVIEFLSACQKRGLKNSYLNGYIKIAKQLDRFLGTDELKNIRLPREQASLPKDLLTPEEILQLANAQVRYRYHSDSLNKRQQALILLLGTTGCRIYEALSLQASDLHDTPPHVVFRDTKNGDDRSVPVSLDLLQNLQSIAENDSVFNGWTGTQLTQQSVNTDLKKRAKACGIKKRVYAHLFRHSYITEMISQGVDWFVLSVIVGHKDPSSTRIYYNQSLARATRVVMQHPLLRPSLSFEQQCELLKQELNKIFNDKTANMILTEQEGEITVHLKKVHSP